MNCKTARLLAELRNELPADDASALDQHLRGCSDCRDQQSVENKLDAPIARAMRTVPVPPGLKSKILDRLATQRGARHRRRFFYAAAAAACVVISVGLLTWKPDRRVALKVNDILVNAELLTEEPREQTDRWLAGQGIRYQPPVALNPRLLAFHGLSQLQGKQVPTLTYRSFDPQTSSPVVAQVYLIRDTDFDLSALPDTFSGSSAQGYHVEIYRDADQPTKLAYVILFKGDREPFLLKFSST